MLERAINVYLWLFQPFAVVVGRVSKQGRRHPPKLSYQPICTTGLAVESDYPRILRSSPVACCELTQAGLSVCPAKGQPVPASGPASAGLRLLQMLSPDGEHRPRGARAYVDLHVEPQRGNDAP